MSVMDGQQNNGINQPSFATSIDNKGCQPTAPPTQAMHAKGPWVEPEFSAEESACVCIVKCCTCIFFPAACCAFQTVQDFERGVVLRLGKQMHKEPVAGGMHMILPCGVDTMLKVDMREQILDIPPQSVTMRDGLTLTVDAVCYFKVFDAAKSLLAVQNVREALKVLSQTKIREALAMHTYDELQQERLKLASRLKIILDDASEPWGVDVTRLELTDVRLPQSMQQAMASQEEAKKKQLAVQIATATQIEQNSAMAANAAKLLVLQAEADAKVKLVQAETLARSKLIEAEGEQRAAQAFKEAADTIAQSPVALQLRYLDVLAKIGQAPSNTIMIPMSPDLMQNLGGRYLENRMVGAQS